MPPAAMQRLRSRVNLGCSPRIALEIDGVSAILDVVDPRLIRQTIEASLKTA